MDSSRDEERFWSLLHQFPYVILGQAFSWQVVCVEENELRAGTTIASTLDDKYSHVLHLSFCSSLPDDLPARSPPPSSQLVTIRNQQGHCLVVRGSHVGFESFADPSCHRYFYLILEKLQSGLVQIQCATTGAKLQVTGSESSQKVVASSPSLEEEEAGQSASATSFYFLVKCTMRNRITTYYLGAEADRDYIAARFPQVRSPLQVFLLRVGLECEVYCPGKDSHWVLQDSVVVLAPFSAQPTPVRLRIHLEESGDVFFRCADDPGQILRVSEDGHLCTRVQVQPGEYSLFEVMMHPSPKRSPSPSPVSPSPTMSLIDMSHDHMDSLTPTPSPVPPDRSGRRPHDSTAPVDLLQRHTPPTHRKKPSQGERAPSSPSSGTPPIRLTISLCQRSSKLHQAMTVLHEHARTHTSTLILTGDAFFARKIHRLLQEFEQPLQLLPLSASASQLQHAPRNTGASHGPCMFVTTFSYAEKSLPQEYQCRSVLYFDTPHAVSFYQQMERQLQPMQILSMVCASDHPHHQDLLQYLHESPNLMSNSSQVEALRGLSPRSRPTLFAAPLDQHIVEEVGEWLLYLTKWAQKYASSSSPVLSPKDRTALQERIERQEPLYLDHEGGDADALGEMLIHFLEQLPHPLWTEACAENLTRIVFQPKERTDPHYSMQREISSLPHENERLVNKLFLYLLKVHSLQRATPSQLAERFAPFLRPQPNGTMIQVVATIIRDFQAVTNASPYGHSIQGRPSLRFSAEGLAPPTVHLEPQNSAAPSHGRPSAPVGYHPTPPPGYPGVPPSGPANPPSYGAISPAALLGFPPQGPPQASGGWTGGPAPPQGAYPRPSPTPPYASPPDYRAPPPQVAQIMPGPMKQTAVYQGTNPNPLTLTGHQATMPHMSPHPAPRRREDWELDPAEIVYQNKIGVGSFGEVWRGEWAGIDVAIKKVSNAKIGPKEVAAFREEINIMAKLRHPNILQFFGACLEPDLCLVTQFAERSSLFHALRDKDLTWEYAKRIIMDVARGMLYLHTRNPPVVHRDIKSLNILVTKDWRGVVADFGLTKIKEQQFLKTYCGSPAWTAPEVLRGMQYDESADVFSFGVVLWEVLSRRPPYEGMSPNIIIGKVIPTNGMRPPIPDGSAPDYVRLMTACWDDVPSRRPTFTQIIEQLKRILGL